MRLIALVVLAVGCALPAYAAQDCRINGHEIHLEELRLNPASGLELRAVRNPEARPDGNCRGGYGGPDLQKLLAKRDWIPGFEVLGAVNGTVFREQSRHYVSNSLLWSKDAGLIAPLRKGGGTHLFVADANGGHELPIATFHSSRTSQDLISLLRKRYPTMTLALQSNMALMSDSTSPRRKTTPGKRRAHWTACPDSALNDWRCIPKERTVLCARSDHGISLLTTQPALPLDLAQGLKRGGACHTDCEIFYNLDGGGSTQMARPDPKEAGGFVFSGRRIETSQPGCSPYRPVDNYLVIGRPR
jgi:hypothetical protein